MPATWVMSCSYSTSGNAVACGYLINKFRNTFLIFIVKCFQWSRQQSHCLSNYHRRRYFITQENCRNSHFIHELLFVSQFRSTNPNWQRRLYVCFMGCWVRTIAAKFPRSFGWCYGYWLGPQWNGKHFCLWGKFVLELFTDKLSNICFAELR